MMTRRCNKAKKDTEANTISACTELRDAKQEGAGLLILTGAGMSVKSGVPVFRHSDGSMSADFLRFLKSFNKARKTHGLREVEDWFGFSTAEMFRKETETEAWQYWRWRVLRALVEPADDYHFLMKLVQYFGKDQTFVYTSNCDMLHQRAGMSEQQVLECHGCLGRLQCSKPCCTELHTVDDAFMERLKADPDWVPRCPHCNEACLRPNVMVFEDDRLVSSHLDAQEEAFGRFVDLHRVGDGRSGSDGGRTHNMVVLEVGAGTVVASIRYQAEQYGSLSRCLVRVNPSRHECENRQRAGYDNGSNADDRYYPLVQRSDAALSALCKGLGL